MPWSRDWGWVTGSYLPDDCPDLQEAAFIVLVKDLYHYSVHFEVESILISLFFFVCFIFL